MENNNKKIDFTNFIHRILATICLALFCGAVFVAHYHPIKTYADNSTETHYRMPSGIYLSYYNDTTAFYTFPIYAYSDDVDSSFYTGVIDLLTGSISRLSSNSIQAPFNQSLGTVQSYLYPIDPSAPSPPVRRIEITISDFYSEKFNSTQFIPILVSVNEDTGVTPLPLCNVYITYQVFNFSNGIYQTESQALSDLDLNSEAVLVNKVFNESYFAPNNGMLHFKDITVLIVFDEIYELTGFNTTIELYRATNDAIDTYNDLLYEHTWEEVEVSVNYLQSFYDTITGVLEIELLPNFSIGTMLELAIAIPLVVWFLKSWLGG